VSSAFKAPFAEATLRCGNCREAMQRVTLPSHYGLPVELDLCAGCHLLWFDSTEVARLSGAAVLSLIGTMAEAQSLPHAALTAGVRCPRCSSGLKTVHNQTRWGHLLQLECANRHGAYQTFGQFLQGKGLLRPMSLPDRNKLLESQGRIDCVNCGADVALDDEECPYCRSVPSLLDVGRLARALDPEGALAPHAVHGTLAEQAALQCGACGAALPPGQSLSCSQCAATLAISRLADAHARVDELSAALQAHAAKPAPEVVKRRLDALGTDLPRRREWVADMGADVQKRSRLDEEFDWGSMFSSGTNPVRAVLIALALWFAWYFWPRG
jgi:Zn-finger nucleic acid-binding protein